MYRPLIASIRTSLLAIGWIALYWFVGFRCVGVETVRGSRECVPTLARTSVGNAYVEVAELVLRILQR